MVSHPKSILFMCGQNAIRSPMAEAMTRALLPKDIFVASAGVLSGARDPFVEVVLNEKNLSLGKQVPQTLDELEDACRLKWNIGQPMTPAGQGKPVNKKSMLIASCAMNLNAVLRSASTPNWNDPAKFKF
jgi:Low molecular weight phosphotyrosine protein phosphatase